ncbi:MAG: argininosuccinate lyase [Acidobacteriota bacterium]
MGKLWGGRFAKGASKEVEKFTESISLDWKLFRQDIDGSRAHAEMLGRQGILSAEEAVRIDAALEEIGMEIESGRRAFDPALEDIHTHIEHWLIEKIGEAGQKLHTARSRNDQVALDLKLYVRQACVRVVEGLTQSQRALVKHAREHGGVVLPGYTHLQRAMPILWAHYLLSFHEMLERDAGRFADTARRADEMPLGAAALAGTGLPIDRDVVAARLGFSRVTQNSLDTVGDRDFVLEFLSSASILMIHLSRLAEDWILFSTSEFGFIDIDEAFCTGSSLMPHKKNPDVLELIRGRSGVMIGRLTGMLAVVKGLPSGYNRDLQEDKAPLLEAVETLESVLSLLPDLIAGVQLRGEVMALAASDEGLMATDLAEYLVSKGLPFRQAHRVVGEVVRHCREQDCSCREFSEAQWKQFSELFASDVVEWIDPRRSVETKRSSGSTGRHLVEQRLDELWAKYQRQE